MRGRLQASYTPAFEQRYGEVSIAVRQFILGGRAKRLAPLNSRAEINCELQPFSGSQ